MKKQSIDVLTVADAGKDRDAIVNSYLEMDGDKYDVTLHVDHERRGVMWNWLRAAEDALLADSDWALIVQDDALPMRGAWEALPDALWYSPTPLLGLSHFGALTVPAARAGIPYLLGPNMIWGAAVAYERKFLEGLVPWAKDIYEKTGYVHDDRLVCAYAQKIGVQSGLTTMALFDQPVEKSTLGHGGAVRRPSMKYGENGWLRFSSLPRYRSVRSGTALDQLQWLATYGTEDEDQEWTFVPTRSGAVRRVRKPVTT